MHTETRAPLVARRMTRHDTEAVAQLDARCFRHAWSEDEFRDLLSYRHGGAGLCAWAADPEGNLVLAGYSVTLKTLRARYVVRLGVHPCWRRHGIGQRLLYHELGRLSIPGSTTAEQWRVVLDVAEENLPAQLWLRGRGFRAVAILNPYDGDDTYYRFCFPGE